MRRTAPPELSALQRRLRFERQRLVAVAVMLGIGLFVFLPLALDYYLEWAGPGWPSVEAEAFDVELSRPVSRSHRAHQGQFCTTRFRYRVAGQVYETGPVRVPLNYIRREVHYHPSFPQLAVHDPRGLRSRHRVGAALVLGLFVLLPALSLPRLAWRVRDTTARLQAAQAGAGIA